MKWIDSWEPEDNLAEACKQLIDEFWKGLEPQKNGKVNTDLKVRLIQTLYHFIFEINSNKFHNTYFSLSTFYLSPLQVIYVNPFRASGLFLYC